MRLSRLAKTVSAVILAAGVFASAGAAGAAAQAGGVTTVTKSVIAKDTGWG